MNNFSRFSLILSILFALHFLGYSQSNIDSLKSVLNTSQDKEELFSAVSDLFRTYHSQGDLEATERYVNYGLEMTSKWDSKIPFARILFSKSRLFDYFGLVDSAYLAAKEVLRIYEEEGYTKGLGDAHNIVGMYLTSFGKYAESNTHLIAAVDFGRKLGDSITVGDALNNLAINYDDLGENDEAIKYYYQAIRSFRNEEDKSKVLRTFGNIADLKSELGYYGEAIDILLTITADIDTSYIENKIGLCHRYNSLAINYSLLDSITLSRKYAKQSITLAQHISYNEELPESYVLMAKSYLRTHPDSTFHYFNIANSVLDTNDQQQVVQVLLSQLEALVGKGYWQQARGVSERLSKVSIIEEHLEANRRYQNLLSKLYYGLGDYKASLFHYQKGVGLKDSLYNIEVQKQIAFVESQFEFAEQERVIAEQQLKVEKTTSQNRFLVIIVLVLLLLAVTIYYYLKQSKKSEALAQKEKELAESEYENQRLLNKEISEELEAIKKGLSSKTREEYAKISVVFSLSDKSKVPIVLGDIIAITWTGRNALITTKNREVYSVSKSIPDFFKLYLPAPLFVQVFKSAVVNTLCVKKIKGKNVIFNDDIFLDSIEVSNKYKPSLEEAIGENPIQL